MKTYISEIMSSVQGEGTRIGCRQVFVRFSGCNLNCIYCDTTDSLEGSPKCRYEEKPGSNNFCYIDNPIEAQEAINLISSYNLDQHHSISFTGGEPLLNNIFIKEIASTIHEKAGNIKFFLETNGSLTEKLSEIINLIDIISMDFKIPSTSFIEPLWNTHRDFLQVANKKEVYVKVVVSDETTDKEIEITSEIIKEINPDIPLIIQPVTLNNKKGIGISPYKIIHLQDVALSLLKDVRVIPQTHLFLGLL